MNDLDRLERLLERCGELLDAMTVIAVNAAAQGRSFTVREQDAWEWAEAQTGELGSKFDALAADLERRGYYPVSESRREAVRRQVAWSGG